MKAKVLVLQGLMAFVALFHVGVGLGLNLPIPGFVDTMATMYGAKVESWSPQFLYILHPLGAFMLALGVLAIVTALRPSQYRPVVWVFAGLFVLRAVHRLVFGQTAVEVFGIPASRNMGNMVFFFALAACLIIADQIAHRSVASESQPSRA
jgi:hypothetical protein